MEEQEQEGKATAIRNKKKNRGKNGFLKGKRRDDLQIKTPEKFGVSKIWDHILQFQCGIIPFHFPCHVLLSRCW